MQDNGHSSGWVGEGMEDSAGKDRARVLPSKRRSRLSLFLVVTALLIFLDQLSKWWIKWWIDANRPRMELLPGFLDLVYVRNDGAFFGLLRSHTEVFIGLGIASVIAIIAFLRYFPPVNNLGAVSFALILSGAVGNLIDRIRLGYVVDFISMHLRDLFHWPAFNLADAALTIGILALIYYFHRAGAFRRAYEHNSRPQS